MARRLLAPVIKKYIMGSRITSLKHWKEIDAHSKLLEKQANRLLGKMSSFPEGKEFRKLRKKFFKKKNKKPNNIWVQPKYADYIKSPEWSRRRYKFMLKYGHSCVICESSDNIHVHHISYRHIGRELDSELVVLCSFHHSEYHKEYGVTRENKNTHKFIEEKRQEIEMKKLAHTLL